MKSRIFSITFMNRLKYLSRIHGISSNSILSVFNDSRNDSFFSSQGGMYTLVRNCLFLVHKIWKAIDRENWVAKNLERATTRGFHNILMPPSAPLTSTATASHPRQTFLAIIFSSYSKHLVSYRNIMPSFSISILLLRRWIFKVLLQPIIFQDVIRIGNYLVARERATSMVGYLLDATIFSPMIWILCTLLFLPFFYFFPLFLPSMSFRDSNVIPGNF